MKANTSQAHMIEASLGRELRIGSENDPRLRTLVDACHSDAVRRFILGTYQGRQLPAW